MLGIIKKIDGLLLALILAHESIFFCVCSILEIDYEGSNDSSAWRFFIIFCLTYMVLRSILTKNIFKQRSLLVLIMPVLFLLLGYITFFSYDYESNMVIFLYIVSWQYLASFLAINVNQIEPFVRLKKSFVFCVFIITLGTFLSFIKFMLHGGGISVGGATYQALSYYAAFSFGMTLYYLNYSNQIFAKKWVPKIKLLMYISIPLQITSLVFGGGRGAAVLFVVYCFIYALNNNKVDIKKYLGWIIFIALLAFIYMNFISQDSFLISRFERLFSYLDGNSVNMASSGRETFYNTTIDYILENPVIGHGLLSYWCLANLKFYPHQLFLEILLEGGIVYLGIWLFIWFLLYKKYKVLKKKDSIFLNDKFLITVILYPIVMLQFSGTYSYNMLYWFGIFLLMTISNKSAKKFNR